MPSTTPGSFHVCYRRNPYNNPSGWVFDSHFTERKAKAQRQMKLFPEVSLPRDGIKIESPGLCLQNLCSETLLPTGVPSLLSSLSLRVCLASIAQSLQNWACSQRKQTPALCQALCKPCKNVLSICFTPPNNQP